MKIPLKCSQTSNESRHRHIVIFDVFILLRYRVSSVIILTRDIYFGGLQLFTQRNHAENGFVTTEFNFDGVYAVTLNGSANICTQVCFHYGWRLALVKLWIVTFITN